MWLCLEEDILARILVIEDDDILRALMRKMLTRSGYEVVEAADGSYAVQLYREHDIDLIVTDLFMPDTEGMEVIRQLRQESQEAKIIAISGGSSFDSIDYLDVARLIGAAKTLNKPFGSRELLEAVDELLSEAAP